MARHSATPLLSRQRAVARVVVGKRVTVEARVSVTPAGLLAIGGLVAAVLWSVVPIVDAARRPRQSLPVPPARPRLPAA